MQAGRTQVEDYAMTDYVHICIVSGQPAPNFLPLIQPDFPAAAVCLLVSDRKRLRQPLAGISAAVQRLSAAQSVEIPSVTHEGLPDTGFAEVMAWGQSVLKSIREQFPGKQLMFNATGGQKIMSTAIYYLLRDATDASVIYCDTDHSRIDMWKPVGTPVPFKRGLRVEHTILLHGYRMVRAKSDNTAWQLPARLELMPDNRPKRSECMRVAGDGVFAKNSQEEDGWFERYVYRCAREIGFARIDGGLDIVSDPAYGRHGENIPNELDLVVVHNNRLP